MLPNHAPIVIAEQFGTLARLFPGRIDLGLGRAPGTDQVTVQALRRTLGGADNFPQDVLELQAYFAPRRAGQRVQAVPAAGTDVPLWILGSSTYGAQLAAALGLPYAFASHFAPDQLIPALEIYRERFKPSAQLARPHAMVGVNIIAADTEREARRLATTQQMSFANIFRGARGLSRPPIDDIESYWSPMEKAQAMQMLARTIIGTPDSVRAGIDALVERDRRRRADDRVRRVRSRGAAAFLQADRRGRRRTQVERLPRRAVSMACRDWAGRRRRRRDDPQTTSIPRVIRPLIKGLTASLCLRRIAVEGGQFVRALHPAKPLGDLNMHRGRNGIGIVIGPALNIDEPGNTFALV